MQKYQITIVSGNEYVINVIAATPEAAKAYALDLDIEQWEETQEVETVISSCVEIENQLPTVFGILRKDYY
jgi:hypothetical protein